MTSHNVTCFGLLPLKMAPLNGPYRTKAALMLWDIKVDARVQPCISNFLLFLVFNPHVEQRASP